MARFSSWTVGSKPEGQNDVFTIRLKYYDKAENQFAEMTVRPNFFFIALILSLLYDGILGLIGFTLSA